MNYNYIYYIYILKMLSHFVCNVYIKIDRLYQNSNSTCDKLKHYFAIMLYFFEDFILRGAKATYTLVVCEGYGQ